MTLREWIRAHRAELDECIARALGRDKNLRANDDERRLWVLNDEGLYRWARSEGVRI
jgi:ABC-type nitrate/sulfonate/bicarbonate transport system substrate-binding protein